MIQVCLGIPLSSALDCGEFFGKSLRKQIADNEESNAVSVAEVQLRKIDSSVIKNLQGSNGHFKKAIEPQDYTYVVDLNDNVYVTDSFYPSQLPADGSPMVIKATDAKGRETGIIPKEIGNLSWDAKETKFKFAPSYTQDLSPDELDTMTRAVATQLPDLDFDREPSPDQERSRVIECSEIVAAQSRHGNYFWNNLMSGTAINAGAIGVTEAAHLHDDKSRLVDKDGNFNREGAYSIGNDLVVGVTNTILGSTAALGLGKIGSVVPGKTALQSFLLKDVLVHFGGRTVASQGIVWVNKKYIYQFIGSKKYKKDGTAKSVASTKAEFDRKFYAIKNLYDALALKGFMHSLPPYLYRGCTQGQVLKVVLSPSAIRIYEKTGVAILYYYLRPHDTAK
jgi:hypothetical protein